VSCCQKKEKSFAWGKKEKGGVHARRTRQPKAGKYSRTDERKRGKGETERPSDRCQQKQDGERKKSAEQGKGGGESRGGFGERLLESGVLFPTRGAH